MWCRSFFINKPLQCVQVETENVFAKHIEEFKLKVHSTEGKYGQLEQEYKKVQDELQTSEV